MAALKQRQSKVREPEIFRGKSDKEIGKLIDKLNSKDTIELLKYYSKGA